MVLLLHVIVKFYNANYLLWFLSLISAKIRKKIGKQHEYVSATLQKSKLQGWELFKKDFICDL